MNMFESAAKLGFLAACFVATLSLVAHAAPSRDPIEVCSEDLTIYFEESFRLPAELVEFEGKVRDMLPKGSKLFATRQITYNTGLKVPQSACVKHMQQAHKAVATVETCRPLDEEQIEAVLDQAPAGSPIERIMGLAAACWFISSGAVPT